MDLYEKSLKTLELPAVLEMLSREAVSRPAKEKALSIRPGGEPAEVRRRLETTAARSMMAAKGSPSRERRVPAWQGDGRHAESGTAGIAESAGGVGVRLRRGTGPRPPKSTIFSARFVPTGF